MGSKYSAGADKVAAEAVARYKSWLGDGRPAPYDGPVHLTAAQIAKTIDHTQLKPDAGERSFRELCAEAMEYGFASVCVQPSWVATCADLLKDTDVDVCEPIIVERPSQVRRHFVRDNKRVLGNGMKQV